MTPLNPIVRTVIKVLYLIVLPTISVALWVMLYNNGILNTPIKIFLVSFLSFLGLFASGLFWWIAWINR